LRRASTCGFGARVPDPAAELRCGTSLRNADTMMMSDQDVHLLREGTHCRLYRSMGCVLDGDMGGSFAVWAPNAQAVSVIGAWNQWTPSADPLHRRDDHSGVWQGRVRVLAHGNPYKFHVIPASGAPAQDKADPFAAYCEPPPATGSRAWSLDYEWHDAHWMAERAARHAPDAPMSVYEVHAGSWQREDDGFLDYRELAHRLSAHLADTGFTHVELMPLAEHPFYGSWGYQPTGLFAPTARYGTPQDLMYLVDHLHQQGIGVILDWVPSHFPTDAHGLARFDGTHLYEHADPRQGFHPEWHSAIFNYGRNEVRAFLLSSAMCWLDRYHMDGLRVDAVASMLYLDYARQPGEWIPNQHGGRENLAAIDFVRSLNATVRREQPDALVIAEESTAWPGVTHPVESGGLGFGLKWNMGWMHDTLGYLREDPVNRSHHHDRLGFSLHYAFSERFILPLSHDEVVYGKGSLVAKMPGDPWQKFANLRTLYGYMWGHPGKKLLFMGCEFAQSREWNHDASLEWTASVQPANAGVLRWVGDLNRFYREEPALFELDCEPSGFQWIDGSDASNSVLAFLRRPAGDSPLVAVLCNFTPVPRQNRIIGVPRAGRWTEVLNSDAREYGGAGWGNLGSVEAAPVGVSGHPFSLTVTLPPLSAIFLRSEAHGAG